MPPARPYLFGTLYVRVKLLVKATGEIKEQDLFSAISADDA